MPLNQLGAAPLVSKTGSKIKAASAVSCFHPSVSGYNQNNETNILARGDIPGGKMQFSKFSELYAFFLLNTSLITKLSDARHGSGMICQKIYLLH